MVYYSHICGFYYVVRDLPNKRNYLPQLDLSVHTTIVASTSRTTLSQNFVNPLSDKTIPELRYTFPLYDGVSVVGFTCTINKDRVIRGVVKERGEARKTYQDAVSRGETAGLLEQLPDASDVFTTTVGNVPAGAEIKVDITYLGELKHDAEVDGIRFTIPTSIAPRYGDYPGELVKGSNVSTKGGIKIVVDAEMPRGSNIKSVQSPSHPISVTIGNTSAGVASGADMSLQKASATLSLGTAELEKDFVLQVVAADTGNPIAVLETHPTLPNHRAIMTTLVPKFNLPSSRPEIVFVCDRSGSMDMGSRIPNLKAALQIFLKSLPLGVKFNICSFGSHHSLLFSDGSVSYDAASLDKAIKHVESFAADFGGTEMYRPLEHVIEKRHKDMDLEVFLLTDGEIWSQEAIFTLVNRAVDESKGAVRVFTLGIGNDVSHALIEGLARAGNGFAQTVMDDEKMNTKVIRMLKAALSPHVKDYTLEVKYGPESVKDDEDTDFEVVEKVMDALTINVSGSTAEAKGKPAADAPKKPISLFDPAADPDEEMADASKDMTAGGKYSGVPSVTEPKLLQAPFIIPPLYSFNRTTVYLLLSPETTQKTPTSVVLRATSGYGPLELEIPITILPEKAETIHQLAARKAIRELEDGRGWIFHAKDASGKLLKEKYPGRFSDMVEREAVRLGVKFQVGGKWCSFVAVDENDKHSSVESNKHSLMAEIEEQLASPQEDYSVISQSCSYSPPAASRTPMFKMGAVLGGGGLFRSGGAHVMQASHRSGGSTHPSFAPTASMPKKLRKSAGPAFGRSAGPATFSRSVAPATFGAAAPPPPPAPMVSAAAMFHAPGGYAGGGQPAPARSRSMAEPEEECCEDEDEEMGFGGLPMDDYTIPEPKFDTTSQPKDALEAIVALQTFMGYWTWTDDLFKALGLDGDAVARAASGPDFGAGSDSLATAIVLAFLETKLKGRQEEWEMLADKAYQWLETAIPNGNARDHVNTVRKVVEGMA